MSTSVLQLLPLPPASVQPCSGFAGQSGACSSVPGGTWLARATWSRVRALRGPRIASPIVLRSSRLWWCRGKEKHMLFILGVQKARWCLDFCLFGWGSSFITVCKDAVAVLIYFFFRRGIWKCNDISKKKLFNFGEFFLGVLSHRCIPSLL